MFIRRTFAISLALALFTGCPGPEKTETAETTKAAEAPAKGAEVAKAAPVGQLPAGTGPVAKVGGVDVPREAFNREYQQTVDRYKRARHDLMPATAERLKDNIVRRLVDAEVIRQQAKKMGMEVAADEKAKRWEEHKKRYGSDQAFKAFLERAGTSADDVKRQFESNLIRERVFAEISNNVKLEDGEAKAFFDKNPERYTKPEQIRASHILIRLPPGATPEVKAEKKALAQKVAKLAKKKDFAKLAKEYGEDPTKDRGGDLNFFARKRMVKEFEDVAWGMKIGKVSGAVETKFGFHIIKKTGHQKEKKQAFKEVKSQIERSLLARKQNSAVREALDKWREESKIEILVKGDKAVIEASRKNLMKGAKSLSKKPGPFPAGKAVKTPGIRTLPARPNVNDRPINMNPRAPQPAKPASRP